MASSASCSSSSGKQQVHSEEYEKEELPLGLASSKGLLFWGTKAWFKSHNGKHCRSKSAPNNDLDLENWDLSPSKVRPIGTAIEQCREMPPATKQGLLKSTQGKTHVLPDWRASLEQDVSDLQKRLRNERAARKTLESAMGRASSAISPGHRYLTPQTVELIDEIKFLEEEVANLEQHVLSLYRRIFNRFVSPSSLFHPKQKEDSPPTVPPEGDGGPHQDHTKPLSKLSIMKQKKPPKFQHRRHISSAGQPSNLSSIQPKTRHASMLSENLSSDRNSWFMPKEFSSKVARSDDGPQSWQDYLCETPNRLSEGLVRCMTGIYCKLSEPPLPHFTIPDSPSSSSSSSKSSLQGPCSDGWSPGSRVDLLPCDASVIDPFQVKGRVCCLGSYSSIVEVPWICVDKDRLKLAARMLRTFRSMVEQLEKVDPSQMKQDEKLAFWINVYNALLMHAYLAYGIPRNNLKRMSLLQKAAYKVGKYSFNAYTIEHCILGCRSYRPTQWLQNFLSPSMKFKAGDERRAYALDTPEPLVYFALCCGGRSDPAVRVYTLKSIHEELEIAKRDFLQATIGSQGDKKLLLPKILEWYAREASMSLGALLEWLCSTSPLGNKEKDNIRRCIRMRPHKSTSHCVEWLPYNFAFRYLLDRDLVNASRVPVVACTLSDDWVVFHMESKQLLLL